MKRPSGAFVLFCMSTRHRRHWRQSEPSLWSALCKSMFHIQTWLWGLLIIFCFLSASQSRTSVIILQTRHAAPGAGNTLRGWWGNITTSPGLKLLFGVTGGRVIDGRGAVLHHDIKVMWLSVSEYAGKDELWWSLEFCLKVTHTNNKLTIKYKHFHTFHQNK